MKLSIIIPVYNVEKYLDECLQSLFCQKLEESDFEILLIDDGSTDSSLSIANNWCKQHGNIRVFQQENQGQAVARNLGIDNAVGDYLMFVDSDDYLLPEKLSTLLTLAQNYQECSIIFKLLLEQPNSTTQISPIYGVDYHHLYSGQEVALRHFVFGSMCRGIFPRKVFTEHNLRFKSGFTHEDAELCFRLYPKMKQVLFVDEEVYFYRFNEQSTDRSTNIAKLKRNIESDALVVSNIFKHLNSYSEPIQKRYKTIANSIMTSFFLRVKNNGIWTKEDFNERINWLRSLNVYPIKGATNSWKTYCLSKLFNIKPLLKLYIFG